MLLCFAPETVWAQLGGFQSGGTAYYSFARPGQNTIQVLVVGDIRRPGLYEVGEDMDLLRLVGLGGGAGAEGVTQERRRDVRVELYRARGEVDRLTYESSFEELVQSMDELPSLQMGDVVQVRVIERRRFGWRDGLQVITSVAALTLAIDRMVRVLSR